MFPSFPKSQKILDDAYCERLFAAKSEVFPPAMHPRVLPIVEGRSSDYQREDRKITPLKLKRHQVKATLDIKEGRGLTLDAFEEKARELGEALGRQMWDLLLSAVNEAADETGNRLSFEKGNLKREDILRMLDTVQHGYDEHGKSQNLLIMHPSLLEEFKKCETEWANDLDFVAKAEEIKRKRKLEFDEREARRRLVK